MTKDKFYITTAIPYVNAAPHIGHALEFVQVDALARFHKMLGKEVLTLTGSDENAVKNVQAAEKMGKQLQPFIDENAKKFKELANKLNIQFDVFQKGSDIKTHFSSSQTLWKLCEKNGDIYKKEYSGLYCVGCETFYTSEDLNQNGECFEHPGRKLDVVSETNYFFKLSKYQSRITQLIESNTLRILPDERRNEVLSFLKKPLTDISISRSNTRAKNWGVPVPDDDEQRIYVWFDALNIYQSGIGFGWDEVMYKKWWPADVHAIGKGITRFHAVYWPAFLMSAGLDLPKSLFVHGYISVDGQKMSKTLGNVVDPLSLIEKYGVDPVRYYLLKEIPTFGDGDYSDKRMMELYNSNLANELGNLVSRITTLAALDGLSVDESLSFPYPVELLKLFERGEISLLLEGIWEYVRALNKKTNDVAPWALGAEDRKLFLREAITKINAIGHMLEPFLPQTAKTIIAATSGIISKAPPLFPRLK